MSYDLHVTVPQWPAEADRLVITALRTFGANATFAPRASLQRDRRGWFPFALSLNAETCKRLGAPQTWNRPREAGFELYGTEEELSFSAKSATGTGPPQLLAMALAQVTQGTYSDLQVGLSTSVTTIESAVRALESKLPKGWCFNDVCHFPADAPEAHASTPSAT